jgi:hypothetical protein
MTPTADDDMEAWARRIAEECLLGIDDWSFAAEDAARQNRINAQYQKRMTDRAEQTPEQRHKIELMFDWAPVFGYEVNHKDPIGRWLGGEEFAGCRDCGVKGKEHLANLDGLAPERNFTKSDRCLPYFEIHQMQALLDME